VAIIPGERKNDISVIASKKNKQKNLVYVFVVILLVMGVVLYFGLMRGGDSNEAFLPAVSSEPGKESPEYITAQVVKMIKATDLTNSILNDERFKNLKQADSLPIVVGQTGRDNPFAPF